MSLINELKFYFQKKTNEELKKFGFIIGVIFIILGFLKILKLGLLFFYLGIILIFLAIFWPISLNFFYKIWMSFGIILGFLTSRFILVVFYCCVIIPVGFILRILKYNPIDKNIDRNIRTYWIKHKNE